MLAMILAAAMAVGQAAPARADDHAVTLEAETGWFWEWSDGSRARSRTISEDQHRTWSALPRLRVASSPGQPGRLVTLEVRHRGRWSVEDSGVTDRTGRAHVSLNPYCADGAWCNETSTYRIRVASQTATFTVRFSPAD
jgi:hypothetical protein